ncbi:hypothetical protein HY091_01680 [Candidatus Kaiserbacteria bacterium]|nr:hypothetical protein [Candidatus Kaiserbacteria bacterium]
MATYDQLKLKEYEYWMLYLHANQGYLGRAYAWLKRPGAMQRFGGLKFKERDELWDQVLHEYENSVGRLWTPEHMNYAWLGNEFNTHLGHGHLHLIPRYRRVVSFAGVEFSDGQWGHNYAPYPKIKLPEAILFAVRDALKKELR